VGGRPDGNRQDNRQRGNAAQLLEKYKSMARDAQLGGDRVQTEYYLQYAEHYYRVLGESRARFEEQRRARGDGGDDGDDDDDDGYSDGDDQGSQDSGRDDDRPERNERPQRNDRPQRSDGNDRPQRSDANDRPQRNDGNDRFERDRSDGGGERYQRTERTPRPPQRYARNDVARNDGDGADRNAGDGSDAAVVTEEAPRAARPPRNANRGSGDGARQAPANVESISFDALPPAIGAPAAVEDDEPAPPKRRVRKPRSAEDESDIAPAA
jgi:hypothetical protein